MSLIKYFVIIILFSFCILGLANYVVKYGLKKTKIEFNGKLNFASDQKKQIDLLLIGSSRVFVQLNPKIIDSITHLNSYNFGLHGATIKTSYNIIQFVLDHQVNAKMVLLNIDFFMFDIKKDLYKDPRFYPYESIKNNFIYENSGTEVFFHKLKIFDVSFYDDNIKYFALDGIVRPNRLIDGWYKGYSPVKKYDFEEPIVKRGAKEIIPFNETDFKILEKTILLCREKGVKIALIIAPYEKDHFPSEYYQNYFTIMNRVANEAGVYNVPVFDFSKDAISKNREYFYNFDHLNLKGTDLYSTIVAEKIRELKDNISDK